MSNTTAALEGAQKEWCIDRNTTLRDLLLTILSNKEIEEHVCASFDTKDLTYKELNWAARRAAVSFSSYSLIAICMRPSLELIITLCGVILCGIPYVPLDPTLPQERINYILKDSQAPVVISDDTLDLEQKPNPIKALAYSCLCDDATHIDIEAVHLEPEDIFCLMYTSGSTGLPKGVRLPHRALLNRLFWQWSQFPFDENDICCLKTSISFVDSITELFGPLLRCVPLIVLPKSLLFQIDQLTLTIALKRITRIIIVPSLLTVLFEHLESNEINIPDLRMIISSGEVLSISLIESFFKVKMRFSSKCCLINLYGSTEVMGDVTCEIFESINNLNDQLSFENCTSIGRPIDNTRVYIVDRDERGIGELVVAGESVANGYHNIDVSNVILFDKFFLDNNGRQQFRTGDLCKIWNDRIILYGRSDTQIKVGGNRIDLCEIELIAKQHFNLHQCIAVYDKVNGQIVLCLQKTDETINIDRFQLAKYLPSYAVPSRIVTITEFPLLVSGKINRSQLADSLTIGRETEEKIVQAPFNRYEAFYSALESIGISRVQLDQTFSAAGGTSLNALSLVAKLHHIGFSHLTVERLFSASKVNDIFLDEIDTSRFNNEFFFEYDKDYQVVPLAQIDKSQGIYIVVKSFDTLGEIDALIHQNQPDVRLEYKRQLSTFIDHNWLSYVAMGLSFGIVDSDGQLLGVSLSADATHELYSDPTTTPLIVPILTALTIGEEKFLERLRFHNGVPESIMNNLITAANINLPPEKRVIIMYYAERHVLQIAATNGFQAVLEVNTGSVAQQLAEHVFKYDENLVIKLRDCHMPSGNLIFPHASPNQTMTVSMKYIV